MLRFRNNGLSTLDDSWITRTVFACQTFLDRCRLKFICKHRVLVLLARNLYRKNEQEKNGFVSVLDGCPSCSGTVVCSYLISVIDRLRVTRGQRRLRAEEKKEEIRSVCVDTPPQQIGNRKGPAAWLTNVNCLLGFFSWQIAAANSFTTP